MGVLLRLGASEPWHYFLAVKLDHTLLILLAGVDMNFCGSAIK